MANAKQKDVQEEYTRRLKEATKILVEAMRLHDAACEKPNCMERANLMAFIAHAIGAAQRDVLHFPRVFGRFEIAVAEAGAPERIELTPKRRKCRRCGCTEDRACVIEGVPCHWVAWDLCSACAGR